MYTLFLKVVIDSLCISYFMAHSIYQLLVYINNILSRNLSLIQPFVGAYPCLYDKCYHTIYQVVLARHHTYCKLQRHSPWYTFQWKFDWNIIHSVSDKRCMGSRQNDSAAGLRAVPYRAVLGNNADWQSRGQVPARCDDVLSPCH